MRVSILTSKETVFEGDAWRAILPCEGGEVCVLDYHQSFVFGLGNGLLKIGEKWGEGKATTIQIKKGIARMEENELICTISL